MNANNESDLHAQEESATTEKTPLKKEKTRKTRLYTYHSNYNDFDAAHNAIMAGFEDGYKWKAYRQVPSRIGSTHWYRCVYSLECPKIQLRHNTVTDLFTIHIDEEQHGHSNQQTTANGIDESSKSFIQEMERLGVKPLSILGMLRKKTTILPTAQQLNNYLSSLRRKRKEQGFLGSNVCLNDFLQIHNDDIHTRPDVKLESTEPATPVHKKRGRKRINATFSPEIDMSEAKRSKRSD